MSKKSTPNKNFVSAFAFDSPVPEAVSSRSPSVNPQATAKRRVVSPGNQQPAAKKAKKKRNGSSSNTNSRLEEVKKDICETLAELHALGVTELSRLFVANIVGFSSLTSTNFAKAISSLKEEGTIEYPAKKKTMRLSRSGMSKWQADRPKSNADAQLRLLAIVKKRVNAPTAKVDEMFELLKDRQVHSRMEVVRALGYTSATSTGFASILSAMNMDHLGLVQNAGRGAIQLTNLAFPYDEDEDEDDDEEEDTPSESMPPPPARVASSNVAVDDASSGSPTNVAVKSEGRVPDGIERLIALGVTDNAEQRLCNGQLQLRALGIERPSRELLAFFAGLKSADSGTCGNAISNLRKKGIFETGNGVVQLSEYGARSLPMVEPPSDNAEMQQHLIGLLKVVGHFPNKMDALFDLLKDGDVFTREEVAAATGFRSTKSGDFNKMLSKPKKLGIIDYPGTNLVQLGGIAFPK